MANSSGSVGPVIQVDVQALSGVVSTSITQAIREQSTVTSAGIAAVTQPTQQFQTNTPRTGTSQMGYDDGQASTSGRKRRYSR